MDAMYFYKKEKLKLKDISYLDLILDNGDRIEIDGAEIEDISVKFYDRLIRNGQGVNPVAVSGYVKLNIVNNRIKCHNSAITVYNPNEIRENRKNYIENRCLYESKIIAIELSNEDYHSQILLGEIEVKKLKDFLVLEFNPIKGMGKYSSKEHYVNLVYPKMENVFSVELRFENCEGFEVYRDEILEFNVNFSKNLRREHDLVRQIVSGFIRIKLCNDFQSRTIHLFNDKKIKFKDFERRLCGKRGLAVNDICHLYIQYRDRFEEKISVADIKSDDEIDALLQQEEEENMTCYLFESGHCKKLKDGSILIAFGKNSMRTVSKFN